jgi:small-conductance mechanosensitive channel
VGKNMGSADRIIRILLALVVGVLILTHQLTGIAAIVLGVLAVIFLLTSFVGFCPAYKPLGISTCRKT